MHDVLHEFSGHNGVDADKYERIYCMLIEEIKEALPNVKFIIMEPFCLKGIVTEGTENEPNKWDVLNAEVRERAKRAKKSLKSIILLLLKFKKFWIRQL